jgi:alpha-beta hydrolase superfamily lysophospholipase
MVIVAALLTAVLGTIGGGYILRARSTALSRALAQRLPVGAQGIIPGAEPIRIAGSPDDAVLLLHGFGDTPRTLAYLARALADAGYTVYVPLLPGHGRTLQSFDRTRAK